MCVTGEAVRALSGGFRPAVQGDSASALLVVLGSNWFTYIVAG